MKISANKEVLLKRFAKEKLSFSNGKLYEAGTELVAIHFARTANILFLLDDEKNEGMVESFIVPSFYLLPTEKFPDAF